MTFDNARDPIEQILEIASAAVYGPTGTTPAATRLKAEVRHFLDETQDIDAALAILIEVGEELGLVTRDALGQFRPRKHRDEDNSAAASGDVSTDGEEGRHTDASTSEAILRLPDSSSDQPAGKARRAKKAKRGKKAKAAPSAARRAAMSSVADTVLGAFAMKARNGIEIGLLRHSQLSGLIGANALENEILDRVRNFGVPPSDLMVHEYVPLPAFEQMVADAKAALAGGGHA